MVMCCAAADIVRRGLRRGQHEPVELQCRRKGELDRPRLPGFDRELIRCHERMPPGINLDEQIVTEDRV